VDSASKNADELLAYVESQRSFGVGDLGTSDGSLIASGLQAPLPLVTTFEQVPDPNIELLSLVQIFLGKILRTEKMGRTGYQPRKSDWGADSR